MLNGNSIVTHERDMSPVNNDNDSSLDETLDSSTADPNLSLSLSQLASKANHRHRRSSRFVIKKKSSLFTIHISNSFVVQVYRRRNVDVLGNNK